MSAKIIQGKTVAAELRSKITKLVEQIKLEHGTCPGLAVVQVGEDPANLIYVRNKSAQTVQTGMASFQHTLSGNSSEAEVLALIDQFNTDRTVHGILVQLPLPEHIDARKVIKAIDPAKDVDGFHILNVGLLSTGQNAMVPCTPLGCFMLLRKQLGSLVGLDAVVMGRSNIVGKPMAQLLLGEHCTVTIAHSRTRDLAKVCRRADILVVAVGHSDMIPGEWVKPGATVIDVGINRVETDGRVQLMGVVHFESAAQVAGAITPVPGGAGPMTIACLLINTLTAFCRAHGLPVPKELTA